MLKNIALNMKNRLGHDDASEIMTVIARMRENRFTILNFNKNEFIFEIKIEHYILCADVRLDSETIAKYKITCNNKNTHLNK